MSVDHQSGSWFTEEQAMLTFALMSVLLAALVIRPYLQFILLGMILAYILWPIRARLLSRLERTSTALGLTVMTIVAIMVPLGYLILEAGLEMLEIIDEIRAGELDLADIEAQLALLGIETDLDAMFETYSDQIAMGLEILAFTLFGFIRTIPSLFIGLTITVFVLFILLRDGDRLLAWTRSILPIRDEIQNELNERLDRLTRASVIGNVAASLIQAVALGVGLWLLGFDKVFFLTVLTFIFALLPLVGAFIVWIPLVFYLVAIGDTSAALLLTVLGMVVSLSDFYTRPLVIGHSAAINSAIIVVGVFGGIVTFGAIGLLVGPVILGGAKIFVEVLIRERNSDRSHNVAT